MQLGIVLITFLVSFVTGLLVYQKNPRSGTNFYFSLLVFFIGAYPVFNYLAIHSTSDAHALLWAKAILFVSIPQGPLLYFFARSFPGSRFVFNKRLQIFILSWVALNLVLAASGLIFKEVSVHNGTVSITPGPFVPLFGILHAGTIIAGIVVLFKKYSRAIDRSKEQLTYVFYGVLISFSFTFLITFVLPIILKSTLLLAVSPLFLAFSVVAIAYAIVSQHLFDIRYVVIRSATYTLTWLLTTLIYIVPSIWIIAKIMGIKSDISLLSFALLVSLVLALFYDFVRRTFNNFTNRMFFRKYYEPQEVLNQLSEVLVATVDVDGLKQKSARLLQAAIKTREYRYWLITDGESERVQFLAKLFNKYKHDNVIFIDDYEDDPILAQRLRDDGVAAAVRLRTTKDDLGFITLGYKESGEIYSDRDRRLLEIAADEIAISLQNALHFEEIQNFNRTLQGKVEAATKELRRSNEKLKALDETKDDFISMASHQLRTPLTSVKGYLSMVLEGDAGKLTATERKMLTQAYASSQRMVYLISDLLNVSRLKTGKFIIEPVPVNLSEVIDEEIAQLVETAQSRSVELEYDKPEGFPTLMLDETKTRQVVMNFIDNAIYYTPAGGHINVILVNKPSTIELKVVDDGIGVPRSEQHHLFTKFYRAKNARRARPDGTGLGLFMAKKVIAAQGGAIIFESSEGKGSTFGFTFSKAKLAVKPVSEPAAPETAIAK